MAKGTPAAKQLASTLKMVQEVLNKTSNAFKVTDEEIPMQAVVV